MQRLKRLGFFLTCTATLAMGCGDDGSPAGSGDTGSSSESGSTTASTSASTSSTTTNTTTSATTTADTSTTSADTGSDSGTDDTAATTTDTTGGGEAMVCQQGCRMDAHCCPQGAIGCPSSEYPNNWTCTDQGLCELGGCENDFDCSLLPIEMTECHEIEGVGTCFEPCEVDDDCEQNQTCTGVADDDAMFCEAEPVPCEEDADCDGQGVCDTDSGDCVCTSDDDCSDDTFNTCAPAE